MDNTDLVVIGGGPAGLSAAIYAARAGVKTCVFGCKPKIAGDYEIDNYFGFPETVSGRELIERGVKQAERFGVKIECERVLGAHADEFGGLTIKTDAREIKTLALIIATGVSRVRPGISNLADFEAKGVSYCVSCDGFFYRGKEVAVVGEAIQVEPYAIMLRKDDPAFKKLVDDTLAGLMKSGDFEKLYKKWFMSPIPPKGINLNAPMSKELQDNLKKLSDKPAT